MTAQPRSRPRVLVTGAAGHVFEGIEAMLRQDVDYVLTDVAPSRDDMHKLDLLDYPAVRDALDGIDIVLHMAIYSKRIAPDLHHVEMNRRQIEVNVLGTQHIMQAACHNNVPHFAYMSSTTTVIGEPAPPHYERDTPYRPSSVYGVTKLFGEVLGEMYARQHNMSVTCMRLAQPVPLYDLQFGTERLAELIQLGMAVAYADIAGAVNVALEPREPGWRVFNVISQNGDVAQRFDLAAGKELGFTPTHTVTPEGIINHAEVA